MIRTVLPSRATQGEDPYAAKLLKYIPAEVLGGFVPLAQAADATGKEALVWVTAGLGLFATPGYLWLRADKLPQTDRPRAYMYLLATAAFVAWALATSSPLRDITGVQASVAEYVVAAVIFIIPLVDSILGKIIGPIGAWLRRLWQRIKHG